MALDAQAGSASPAVPDGRLRRWLHELTGPTAFPRLALLAFTALYVNVVSGASVRLTNSGLGCPDWPLCHGGPAPPLAGHAVIEFSNRVIAAVAIVSTLLCAVSAFRTQRRTWRGRWLLALAIAVGTFAQGPLGGITVLLNLNPIAVMSHFLLAFIVLSLATVLVVDVYGGRSVGVDRPAWLVPAAVGFTLWAFALIVSGAVVTMSGTHPGGNDVPRMWNLLDAAYLHVRIAVSYVVVLAGLLYAVARLRTTGSRVPALAWAVVAATGLQIVVGEIQWRTQLPWWLVLVHVSVAGALWIAVVAFARSLVPARAG